MEHLLRAPARLFVWATTAITLFALTSTPATAQEPLPSDLQSAVRQYVQDRGETYFGQCKDAEIEQDVGKWCYEVRELSDTEATITLGPTFSEFVVVATFSRSWQLTEEQAVGRRACPEPPFWVDFAGAGFYWDPVSGQVWTSERGWHRFDPQANGSNAGPPWVDAPNYSENASGFYYDPVSGLVWTSARGWHVYEPLHCGP